MGWTKRFLAEHCFAVPGPDMRYSKRPTLGKYVARSLLLTALAACASEDTNPNPLRLAFITNNEADFWERARLGCLDAASGLAQQNVEVLFHSPAAGTAAEQNMILEQLLALPVDGVAISPVDPVSQVEVLNRVASQVMLVTHDSDAPESSRAFYIGTDNREAGRMAGRLLLEALPAGGSVMMFAGLLDAENVMERIAGIEEALVDSDIKILDVRVDGTDPKRAKANVLDSLVHYPEIGALVGLWSYNCPAILEATRETGKSGSLPIICFDLERETIEGIRDGKVLAAVVQQPYEFCFRAIHMMAAQLQGHQLTAEGHETSLPRNRRILLDSMIVRRENLESFLKQSGR